MSTTPPEQPTTPQQPAGGYGSSGPNVNLNLAALMPTPGNAELVVYILATIVVGIVALSDDRVDGPEFVDGVHVLHVRLLDLTRHREGEPRARTLALAPTRTAASPPRAGLPSGSPA